MYPYSDSGSLGYRRTDLFADFMRRDYSHTPTFWTHSLFGQLRAWRQAGPALNLLR